MTFSHRYEKCISRWEKRPGSSEFRPGDRLTMSEANAQMKRLVRSARPTVARDRCSTNIRMSFQVSGYRSSFMFVGPENDIAELYEQIMGNPMPEIEQEAPQPQLAAS